MYDSRQMNQMRQDAIRRSREMHRRSVVNTAHYSQGQQQKTADSAPTEAEKNNNIQPMIQQAAQYCGEGEKGTNAGKMPLSELFARLLPDGRPDSDKLMIIALIIILAREGADIKLLIALAYILI